MGTDKKDDGMVFGSDAPRALGMNSKPNVGSNVPDAPPMAPVAPPMSAGKPGVPGVKRKWDTVKTTDADATVQSSKSKPGAGVGGDIAAQAAARGNLRKAQPNASAKPTNNKESLAGDKPAWMNSNFQKELNARKNAAQAGPIHAAGEKSHKQIQAEEKAKRQAQAERDAQARAEHAGREKTGNSELAAKLAKRKQAADAGKPSAQARPASAPPAASTTRSVSPAPKQETISEQPFEIEYGQTKSIQGQGKLVGQKNNKEEIRKFVAPGAVARPASPAKPAVAPAVNRINKPAVAAFQKPAAAKPASSTASDKSGDTVKHGFEAFAAGIKKNREEVSKAAPKREQWKPAETGRTRTGSLTTDDRTHSKISGARERASSVDTRGVYSAQTAAKFNTPKSIDASDFASKPALTAPHGFVQNQAFAFVQSFVKRSDDEKKQITDFLSKPSEKNHHALEAIINPADPSKRDRNLFTGIQHIYNNGGKPNLETAVNIKALIANAEMKERAEMQKFRTQADANMAGKFAAAAHAEMVKKAEQGKRAENIANTAREAGVQDVGLHAHMKLRPDQEALLMHKQMAQHANKAGRDKADADYFDRGARQQNIPTGSSAEKEAKIRAVGIKTIENEKQLRPDQIARLRHEEMATKAGYVKNVPDGSPEHLARVRGEAILKKGTQGQVPTGRPRTNSLMTDDRTTSNITGARNRASSMDTRGVYNQGEANKFNMPKKHVTPPTPPNSPVSPQPILHQASPSGVRDYKVSPAKVAMGHVSAPVGKQAGALQSSVEIGNLIKSLEIYARDTQKTINERGSIKSGLRNLPGFVDQSKKVKIANEAVENLKSIRDNVMDPIAKEALILETMHTLEQKNSALHSRVNPKEKSQLNKICVDFSNSDYGKQIKADIEQGAQAERPKPNSPNSTRK